MLIKILLVTFVAAGCVGCARDRTPLTNAPEAVVTEPTRVSEAEQSTQGQQGPNAIPAAVAQIPPQRIPAGTDPSRMTQAVQPNPNQATQAPLGGPVLREPRQTMDDCRDGHGNGQSGDCQDAGHHGHDHAHHEEHPDKKKPPPPKVAQAASTDQKRVNLLFYHEPNHCPHCRYEMPQIRAFQQNHGDVNVIWRPVGTTSARERELLRGVSGHPIMAFYTDDGHKMLVRGETPAAELDTKLNNFKRDVLIASQNGRRVNQTTGSNIVCQ